jgi:dTDP-4-amino-4,6-dideoxygalactose transaminase
MNSRLDTIQAAILRVKLRYLEQWTEQRRQNATRYRRFIPPSVTSSYMALPMEPDGTRHVYNQFTIRCKERDRLREHLLQNGIPTEIYYPHPLHLQPAFSYLGYREGSLPYAESVAREVVSLPIYPELTADEQRRIVGALAAFYGRFARRERGE